MEVTDLPPIIFKVYKRRWVMLCLYFIISSITCLQWSQYSTIADVVVKYYNVSYEVVNWSSMIFLLMFILFVCPGSYILKGLGLRNSLLLTSCLQCVGCWLKVVAVNPNRFWLVLVSQIIFGLTQVSILSTPSLIAMTWFGINEISTATSIGTLSLQISIGLSFFVPIFTISNVYEEDVFEKNLFLMVLSIAIFSTACLVLVFLFFENKPRLPPSEAQFYRKRERKTITNIIRSVKDLFKNFSFISILLICGISNGIGGAIDTLLNQIIIINYKDSSAEAGKIELLEYLIGSVGLITTGILLDKFKQFKTTIICSQGANLVLMVVFTYILHRGILGIYIILSLSGIFSAAVLLACFETAMEVTYPISENIPSGIFYATQYIFTIIFTHLYSWIFYTLGDKWSNYLMCALHLVAFLLPCCIHYELHRQNVRH